MNQRIRGYVIGISILILVSIIAFIPANEISQGAWISYVFLIASFILFFAYWTINLRETMIRKNILGIPAIVILAGYAILQTIWFLLCVYNTEISLKNSVIVSLVLLLVSLIIAFALGGVKEQIENDRYHTREKINRIRDWNRRLNELAEKYNGTESGEKLRLLAEAVRLSDPMGGNNLYDIENEIEAEIIALESMDSSGIPEAVEKTKKLLDKRNRICRDTK